MKNVYGLVMLTLASVTAVAQLPAANATGVVAHGYASTVVTPEQAIANARDAVAKNPKNVDSYVALGLALCHRGDDISDAGFYDQAENALDRALELLPNNFDAEKGKVCVDLGRHEFAHARDKATVLNKRVPDDLMVYGLLVDANVGLGNYAEAEKAAQWMLNLRPGNTPALLHAAGLREVFGDQEGAIELLRMVLDATAPGDVERRVNTLTQIARLNLETGNLDSAESELQQALKLLPNHHNALNEKAQLCLLRGQPADAVQWLSQSYKAVPQAQTLYALAGAMESAGMKEDAARRFAEFARQAESESSRAANDNRDLIFYYTDRANKPARALQIAEQEMSRRHDVDTLDAYGWVLYRNGRTAEARQQFEAALKVGVRDASIFYHAGEVELQLNNVAQAQHYFRAAAEMNSMFSEQARTALATAQLQSDVAR